MKVKERGEIRSAIRYACEREKGGVLMLRDTDDKSGDFDFDILKAKYSDARDVSVENLPMLESCPELIEVEVTDENVERLQRNFQDRQARQESTQSRCPIGY